MSITFKEVEHTYSENTPFEYAALKGIDLNIKKGSMTAIIGHTGSGKSTLIQHINALLQPTSGFVQVEDYIITPTDKPKYLKPLRKLAGLVFQFPEYQLFEETIEKDIMFGPKNFKVEEEEAKRLAAKALTDVGMDSSYLDKPPFDLSGGQKRRVAIAGILVMEPEIIILDEPTAGLDPQGAYEIMGLFKKLNEQGKTVIIVTHDMDHVLQYCNEAVVMSDGKVVKQCSVKDLFKDPSYLLDLSINLPTITNFIYQLNQNGFQIDPSIKDINVLRDAIKEAIQ